MKLFDGTISVAADRTTTGTELTFDVVAFGSGTKPLVVIPGLSDGLATVRGKGFVLAWYYRALRGDYRIHVISRPTEMPDGYTTRAMAADYAALFRGMGFAEGSVLLYGISQGGMIAQWLAVDAPELLRRVCIAVSLARPNGVIRSVIGGWIRLAEEGRYGELMRDAVGRTYSEKKMRRIRLVMPFLELFGRPKSFRRFIVQAEACVAHDAAAELHRVPVPVLVIGGGVDRVVGPAVAGDGGVGGGGDGSGGPDADGREGADDDVGPGTSEELAALIPGARLKVYPELGHGAFEEAPDALDVVLGFFEE